MNSISPPILPAISSEEGREVVDEAVRGADDRQIEESAAPNAGAEAQVDVEDVGGAARKVSDVGNFRLRICRPYQRSGSTRQLTCHIGVGAMNVSRHLPESGRICTRVRMVEPFQ